MVGYHLISFQRIQPWVLEIRRFLERRTPLQKAPGATVSPFWNTYTTQTVCCFNTAGKACLHCALSVTAMIPCSSLGAESAVARQSCNLSLKETRRKPLLCDM
eukprot:Blabericola_migrator_1__6837@NODE_3464_length_1750_cov_3_301842_g2154_i0_p1_GENE_NODE_3464_length_1750_cov_3_301842_g2154_i0NODE_3464_length_1750_cov_3_301842_g2154_i0_p1_ORF_typecomplete_len103_score6_30_NODE_3464_length_1750_cov_3_301842_g2154_i0605913